MTNIVWEKVLLARHAKRPTAKQLIGFLVTDFVEMHGDRLFADDASIIGGIGFLDGMPITVIAQEKGQTTTEKMKRNFGMAHPEGYRKALRLMQQAEKFNRPLLFIIDTPGAYPGIGAEERGQASAIATNLFSMIALKVPSIAIILGEGGSGGALAIGISDQIWMFENAIYSILSPEGFASILYKDASLAKTIAPIMKITAQDLLHYEVIDAIIPEFDGGLHINTVDSFKICKEKLIDSFKLLRRVDPLVLCQTRYEKYRTLGHYEDN